MAQDFANRKLRGHSFAGQDLAGANFQDADAREANFAGANLSEANLRGANFSQANLSEANLTGADLCGTTFARATLTGADVRQVKTGLRYGWSLTLQAIATIFALVAGAAGGVATYLKLLSMSPESFGRPLPDFGFDGEFWLLSGEAFLLLLVANFLLLTVLRGRRPAFSWELFLLGFFGIVWLASEDKVGAVVATVVFVATQVAFLFSSLAFALALKMGKWGAAIANLAISLAVVALISVVFPLSFLVAELNLEAYWRAESLALAALVLGSCAGTLMVYDRDRRSSWVYRGVHFLITAGSTNFSRANLALTQLDPEIFESANFARVRYTGDEPTALPDEGELAAIAETEERAAPMLADVPTEELEPLDVRELQAIAAESPALEAAEMAPLEVDEAPEIQPEPEPEPEPEPIPAFTAKPEAYWATIDFGVGNFAKGFSELSLQIWTRDRQLLYQYRGQLPKVPELAKLYNQWRQMVGASYPIPPTSQGAFQRLTNTLKTEIDRWLEAEEFQAISRGLRSNFTPDREFVVVLRIENFYVRRLPWAVWSFWQEYPRGEVAVATGSDRPFAEVRGSGSATQSRRSLKVLAMLAHSEGTNLQADRVLVKSFPRLSSDTLILEQPVRKVIEKILQRELGWDVIFFGGIHPQIPSDGVQLVRLNDRESYDLDGLKLVLRKAIARGTQVAIFNATVGIVLADRLAEFEIPKIIWREPVPNAVAQAFFIHFVGELCDGQPFPLAVRAARESLEADYLGSSLLPAIAIESAIDLLRSGDAR